MSEPDTRPMWARLKARVRDWRRDSTTWQVVGLGVPAVALSVSCGLLFHSIEYGFGLFLALAGGIGLLQYWRARQRLLSRHETVKAEEITSPKYKLATPLATRFGLSTRSGPHLLNWRTYWTKSQAARVGLWVAALSLACGLLFRSVRYGSALFLALTEIISIIKYLRAAHRWKQVLLSLPKRIRGEFEVRANIDSEFPRVEFLDSGGQRSLILTSLVKPSAPSGKQFERVVNTGFAERSRASRPLSQHLTLRPGKPYFFWLDVGPPVTRSMESTPFPLPVDKLPEGAELAVALFEFADGIRIHPGGDIGRIKLQPDGSARVSRQPGGPRPAGVSTSDLETRLFFGVKAPWRLGRAKLRCNIYYEQVLVQSRLITVRLKLWPANETWALRSDLEYSLSRSLLPRQLAAIAPHRLSVMLNHDADARYLTHQLRFFGQENFKADVRLTDSVLEDIIRETRQVMRRVAWGANEEWTGQAYRYGSAIGDSQLAMDLFSLARTGYRLYSILITDLADSTGNTQAHFGELMAAPGLVQFASMYDVREYLPASLIYDHPLDTGLDLDLCPEFRNAMECRRELASTDCFNGRCPSRGKLTIVCPSGFWGFRHELSFPLSTDRDASTCLHGNINPKFAMAISTALELTEDHALKIQSLRNYGEWSLEKSRDATLTMLGQQGNDVVYFYCHGGFSGSIPYIQVGPATERGITSDNLVPYQVVWNKPGPLVFLNGCRTGALQPSVAFDLVTAFVKQAKASGVIGTEITVFEPLACKFAEHFFRAFLVQDRTVGGAVRHARLALLEGRNPLGLVYVPFALGTLTLADPELAGMVSGAAKLRSSEGLAGPSPSKAGEE